MRLHFLSPHRFEQIQSYVDTLVVSSFHPTPLDIAIPISAAAWIGDEAANRLTNKIQGRATRTHFGMLRPNADLLSDLKDLTTVWIHAISVVISITDRAQGEPKILHTLGQCHVLSLDWWRWLETSVPASRFTDALMYMSMACTDFKEAEERFEIGMPESTLIAMGTEGDRILDSLVAWMYEEIQEIWRLSAIDSNT